ncbi:MAG TPA: DUF2934 domain-containing protein [Povalibacter sp.]|uniref:DUF2934 domain-containing protein n=1 Tax=Povalibacter sp. TaxID=1962978 RepID=UPI002D101400|nr:DUF2934 domain-containing protein [Povalibacter sp.]HMN47104.1 DUF2934 domain-containing protein [Povalibacter sp.]
MPARIRDSEKTKAAVNPASATPDDPAESTPELRLLGELRPVTTREERIAMNAYWRAASRQFAPGHELDDWLAAEAEVDEKYRK